MIFRADGARLDPAAGEVASASITGASAAKRFTAAMPLRYDSFDSYVSLVATTRPFAREHDEVGFCDSRSPIDGELAVAGHTAPLAASPDSTDRHASL
jgi:hypothetical protein